MSKSAVTTHCTRTLRLKSEFPEMRFCIVLGSGINPSRFAKATQKYASDVAAELDELSEMVRENLANFEEFFNGHDRSCPLRKQIATASKRGFPPVPSPVLALLALEAATGVLMGVQDLDAVDGNISLDRLPSEESFVGMRGEYVRCTPGEIVVRDGTGIIASLFQGPDKRTAAKPSSRNLLFYVFDAHPSLGDRHSRAVDEVASLVAEGAATATTIQAD